jgi:hypothetical protein
MAKIDSFSFGSIVVDGKKYRKDLIFLPDGTVKQREGGFWMFGSHDIKKEEIEELSRAGAESAIVGIGTSSRASVSDKAKKYAQETNLDLSILPSHEAVEKLNELVDQGKKVAALIHITC